MREYQIINPIKHEGVTKRSGAVTLSDTEGALLAEQGFVAITGTTLARETSEAADPPLAADNETGAATDIQTGADEATTTTDAPPASEAAGGGESPAAAPAQKPAAKKAAAKKRAADNQAG